MNICFAIGQILKVTLKYLVSLSFDVLCISYCFKNLNISLSCFAWKSLSVKQIRPQFIEHLPWAKHQVKHYHTTNNPIGRINPILKMKKLKQRGQAVGPQSDLSKNLSVFKPRQYPRPTLWNILPIIPLLYLGFISLELQILH